MRFKKKIIFLGGMVVTLYLVFGFFAHRNVSNKLYKTSERIERQNTMKVFRIQNNTKEYLKNFDDGSCESENVQTEPDVQVLNLYHALKFDNVDGGVWKQGWNIEFNSRRWNRNNKLKVFVVPHSHNDPGWKRTFEQYYELQTKHILNNMVEKLSEDPRRKFIWAEVSYLSLWWAEISESVKVQFRRLLDNGQVEIVSGGWVMPDEANSHYYSLIQELTHGHQWLQKYLNYEPKHSWCIDPFGTSPIMPFLLHNFNLKSLVIQRTHYSVKKYLAKFKQLEFRWRQMWDKSGNYDFMTHMMPFYIYDIPHTCGPDPAICCQFDFIRSHTGISCPWGKLPKMINDRNVAQRAEILLDQYRKKAELYLTNVLLVPLGDDFRYEKTYEWDRQFQNYQKLFDYMNRNPTLFVDAKFGTLEDYFEALHNEKTLEQFPSLSGDFFTYADRDDHYWSGYFTSRPYYKRMDRELISYLRSAEILHSIAWKTSSLKHSSWLLSERTHFVQSLRNARASLSLFQHHDGITGTSKDFVVDDYARKLQDGMTKAEYVMQQTLNFLLTFDKNAFQVDPQAVYFELKESRKTPGSSESKILKISESEPTKRIVIFNSLTWHRSEILNVKIENYEQVTLLDENDEVVPYQINPFCEVNDHYGNCFLLHFEVKIKPLSVKTFFLKHKANISNEKNLGSLTVLNANGLTSQLKGIEKFIKHRSVTSDFSIQNDKILVIFHSKGLIKAIHLKKLNLTIPVALSFVSYSCRKDREMCGAYLFLPDGRSRIISCLNPFVKIIEGRLVSSVIVYCDFVIHAINVYNSTGIEENIIEIQNLVDVKTENNFEIAMKITSSIKNKGVFYTDLNGYQVIKRQYFDKLPIQGNYYPMPTTVYIEDESARITVVSAQPLGAASLKEGEIEIMQDRRLNQDDNLGLGEPVLNNRPILHIFRLIVEKKNFNCEKVKSSHPAGYLSVIAYLEMNAILYPLMLFLHIPSGNDERKLYMSYENKELLNASIDVHLVSMTTIPETPAVGIILHRTDLDTCFYHDYENSTFSAGLVNVTSYIPTSHKDVVYRSSLSFTKLRGKVRDNLYPLCTMNIAAFYITNVNITAS